MRYAVALVGITDKPEIRFKRIVDALGRVIVLVDAGGIAETKSKKKRHGRNHIKG